MIPGNVPDNLWHVQECWSQISKPSAFDQSQVDLDLHFEQRLSSVEIYSNVQRLNIIIK